MYILEVKLMIYNLLNKLFDCIVKTISKKLKDKNINIEVIDIGGIGINYTDEDALNINDYAALISKNLDH